MQHKTTVTLFTYAAVFGNILFMLWVSYNALKEHFSGTLPEKISYAGLMALLALNSFLILKQPSARSPKIEQKGN